LAGSHHALGKRLGIGSDTVASAVVISTHLDDAVFSCWRVIADGQHQVSVVTVFTTATQGRQSSWDACIDPNVDSEARARERQGEDRAALSVAGRVPVHLPFHDAEFGPTDPARVAKALEPHIEAADAVYAPLAIAHPDHVLVRDAVRRVGGRPNFYVDYPYALKEQIQPLQAPPGFLDAYAARTVLLTDGEVATKLAACREYSGELKRLGMSFGDFVTAENLCRETIYEPHALD
jgi:hypothetical protein